MIQKVYPLFFLVFFFIGCNDITYVEKEQTQEDYITIHFVDDFVNNLNYRCSSGVSGMTQDEGNISCPKDDNVTIYLGEVALPSVTLSKTFITPYSFFNDLNSSLNLARLLQSLDTTSEDNYLIIDTNKTKNLPKNLDFQSKTFQDDLNGSIELISLERAMQHLNETLTDLNISLSQDMQEQIQRANNHPPIIILNDTYSIYENQKFITSLKAEDEDNDTLTFSLEGKDAQSFEINSSNNTLVFKDFPDYEKKKSYVVDIVVDDKFQTISKEIKILILNVIDDTVLEDTTLQIAENVAIESVVGSIKIKSFGDSNISTYDLNGSGSEDFTIDSSGIIKTAKVLDYENIPSYTLNVKLTTQAQTSSSAIVYIDVLNQADKTPILVPTVLNVLENSALKTTIGKVTIQDEGDSPITSMHLSGSDKFSITSDGTIVLEQPLDYEECNEYNLSVNATNVAGESGSVSVKIFVNNVLDINEKLAATSLSVEENATLNSVIGQVNIEQSSDASRVAFNLLGDYSSYFDIDLDGVIRLKKSLNYEQKNRYDLIAYTTTQIGQSNRVSVTVNVTDIDEVPELAPTKLTVYENSLIADEVGRVSIAFEGDTPIQSMLLSGDGSEKFNVDNQGVVTLTQKLDYETIPFYQLSVTATNSIGTSSEVDLNISVLDIAYKPFEVAKIKIDEESFFGYATAIDGNYFVVGTPFRDSSEIIDSGGVYLYKKELDDSVSQLQLLLPQTLHENDNFGYSVALSYPYIVVGAPYDDTNESDSGAVYLFEIGSDSNITQIAKVKASSINENDNFGYSVAIDGSYFVVGTPGDDEGEDNSGAVYLFKIEDGLVSQLQKLQANSRGLNDNFGFSVDISQNYIVVGAPNNDSVADDAGMAYLFKKVSDTDISQIDSFSDANEADSFSNSVAIDGNLIVVGAYKDDTQANDGGAAYLYEIVSDEVSKVAKITPSSLGSGDYFGNSVAISGDKFVVGAYLSDGETKDGGGVYSFYKDGTKVVQQSQLELSSYVESGFFGSCVSIDKDFIVAGAFGENRAYLFDAEAPFSIYVYSDQFIKTIQEEQKSDIFHIEAASALGELNYKLSENDASFFGVDTKGVITNSVELDFENPQDSNKNNNYIFTAVLEDLKGRVKNLSFSVLVEDLTYVFTKKEGLLDGEVDDRFGYSIAVDGEYVVVGIPNKQSVYLYKKSGSGVEYVTTITQDDTLFGYSLALEGNNIIIGTQGEKGYWFVIEDDESVTKKDTISADDNEDGDKFGTTVALFGDYIVMGAPQKDDAKGALYLFKKDSSSVSQIMKIKTGENSGDTLGASLAISQNYIVAGAPYSDANEDDGGVAYLFKIEDDDSVTELTQIDPETSNPYDRFATAIAMQNNIVAISAPYEDSLESNSGALYLFKIEDNNITQIQQLKSIVVQKNRLFGETITLKDDFALVASTKSNYNATVELYELNSTSELNYKQTFHADTTQTYFGAALGVDAQNLFIGSYKEDESGVVYIFRKDN